MMRRRLLVRAVRRQIAIDETGVALHEWHAVFDEDRTYAVLLLMNRLVQLRLQSLIRGTHGKRHVVFHRNSVFHQVDRLKGQGRVLYRPVVAGERAPGSRDVEFAVEHFLYLIGRLIFRDKIPVVREIMDDDVLKYVMLGQRLANR